VHVLITGSVVLYQLIVHLERQHAAQGAMNAQAAQAVKP